MFERYTEHARRTIFFARYEASNLKSGYIEPEHLLLGLLREDPFLRQQGALRNVEAWRVQIQSIPPSLVQESSTSVDLPLSNDAKKVLAYACEEADNLKHRNIESCHLMLGLLHLKDSAIVGLLEASGVRLGTFRDAVAIHLANPSESATAQGRF